MNQKITIFGLHLSRNQESKNILLVMRKEQKKFKYNKSKNNKTIMKESF